MEFTMNQSVASLELIEERTFTARLHDRNITGLAVESAWEGFTKFRHSASGLHLIVLDAEKRVVSGSPSLMSSLGLVTEEHFVTVAETTLPNGRIVPAFKYAKYPASKDDSGALQLSASAKPWVSVSFSDAAAACAAAGYQLARESQELAIRLQVVQQAENWTGGAVGVGKVFQGLHKGTVRSAQAADYVSDDPEERSWHVLANGEKVYGLAGNIYTHVYDDVQGDSRGLCTRIADDSPSLTTAPYPSCVNGMGYRPDGARDWSGGALIRGGFWIVGDDAGVFGLNHAYPSYASDYVGFRCTKTL
jgi:hypothetical protein